ncbi:helix-turn-helix domain-containing protein [Actinophytocola sediminis]
MTAVREPGGRYLQRRRYRWPGMSLELARWRGGPATEAVCHLPEHLLFVTFGGVTSHTEAWLEDGQRYTGADFPGAVTFIPANQRRQARHGDGVLDYATILLDPGRMPTGIGDAVEFAGFTNRPDPLVHQLALALRAEAATRGVAGQLFVDGVATTLALHLLRRYSSVAPHRPARPPTLTGGRLRRVLAHIGDDLGGDLRLTRLAGVAGLAPHQFGRAFKQATGMTPHQYVLQRRVERAAELLARSAVPIAEVADTVGMSSQSHLTSVFRRVVGDTPHAYRRAARRG